MADDVSRIEFEKLYTKVENQGKELTVTAIDIRGIKVLQSEMCKTMEKMADSVTLNKMQIVKLIAGLTPLYALISYALSRLLVKVGG